MTIIEKTEHSPVIAVEKPLTLHSIQALRALAAMLVVMYHGQLTFSTRVNASSFAGESYLFAFGAVGVHIFFVISGFIMVFTSRFDTRFNARAFMRRRILRIYPIYWICVVLYLGFHALMGIPYDIKLQGFFGALLLLPGDASRIIGPAWTLAFEMFFYICFGIAMLAGLNRGLLFLSIAFLSMIAAGIMLPFDNPAWNLVTNALLIEFVAGAVIGWLVVRNYLPTSGGIALILIAIALFACGVIMGYNRFSSVVMWGLPSVLLIAGAVMVETARTPPAWVRKIGHFGDSSYVLYLVHILVITIAVQLTSLVPGLGHFEPATAALFIAILALIIAEFLHHRIEKPLMRWLNAKRARHEEAKIQPIVIDIR